MRSLSQSVTMIVVSFSAWLLPGAARADIGPRRPCPGGLTPRYHMGRYCAPTSCTSDSQCGGRRCVVRSLCLHDRGERDTKRTSEDPEQPARATPIWQYAGVCTASGLCAGRDSECVTERFCEGGDGSDDPGNGRLPSARGCSCDATSASAAVPAGALFAVVVTGLALARRRRARARRRDR